MFYENCGTPPLPIPSPLWLCNLLLKNCGIYCTSIIGCPNNIYPSLGSKKWSGIFWFLPMMLLFSLLRQPTHGGGWSDEGLLLWPCSLFSYTRRQLVGRRGLLSLSPLIRDNRIFQRIHHWGGAPRRWRRLFRPLFRGRINWKFDNLACLRLCLLHLYPNKEVRVSKRRRDFRACAFFTRIPNKEVRVVTSVHRKKIIKVFG